MFTFDALRIECTNEEMRCARPIRSSGLYSDTHCSRSDNPLSVQILLYSSCLLRSDHGTICPYRTEQSERLVLLRFPDRYTMSDKPLFCLRCIRLSRNVSVQTYIPVTQIIYYEILYRTARTCRLVFVKGIV